ncbi:MULTISPECIES: ABC transporter ATP-binding protein [Corynebacterium]|nr:MULTISPECIES: ABC transporter ATP-binding protein [Corynebacterium]
MPSMEPEALVLNEVVKQFGPKRAVDGVSFTARRGELLALLGPNGAGKTTTIEMCEGFTQPTSGSIRVLGYDPATEPQRVRDRIGIMLQGGGSYSGVKVREMLHLAASYNEDPHDPDWLIELLGLEGVASTTYRRLSGGQQQRLSLALAIIGRPELLFLDEPTAGMDAQSRLAVWELVNAMKRDGTTIVLTTHLMDEAESLADRVVIVDRGRVVATGEPAELTSHEDYPLVSFGTAQALDLETFNDSLRAFGAADREAENVRPLSYRVRGDGSPQLVEAIAHAAAQQDVLLRELSVSHRNLEDVFLDITGRELRS